VAAKQTEKLKSLIYRPRDRTAPWSN